MQAPGYCPVIFSIGPQKGKSRLRVEGEDSDRNT